MPTVRAPESKAFNAEEWVREHEERAYFERKRGMVPLRLFAGRLPRAGVVVGEEWRELVEAITNAWADHFLPVNLGSTLNGFQQLLQANPYVGPNTSNQQTQANPLSLSNLGSFGSLGMGWPAPGSSWE